MELGGTKKVKQPIAIGIKSHQKSSRKKMEVMDKTQKQSSVNVFSVFLQSIFNKFIKFINLS